MGLFSPAAIGKYIMNKQTIEFAVHTQNRVIKSIGKSVIYTPRNQFKGGSIKWYQDKIKD